MGRALGRLLVTYPPMSFKVIAGIHWQALRSWLKGAKYHRRPDGKDLHEEPETGMLCPVKGSTRESSELQSEKAA